jgi:type I restriction enzyme M protein
MTKDKTSTSIASESKQRNRRGEVLFIDASNLGRMVNRTVRELSDEDINRIQDTYNNWRAATPSAEYTDEPGFCVSTSIQDIAERDYVLTPGRYVGSEAVEDDLEPIEEKIARVSEKIQEDFQNLEVIRRRVEAVMATLRPSDEN